MRWLQADVVEIQIDPAGPIQVLGLKRDLPQVFPVRREVDRLEIGRMPRTVVDFVEIVSQGNLRRIGSLTGYQYGIRHEGNSVSV